MTEEIKKERELTLDEKYKILKANHEALVKATTALEQKYFKAVARNEFLENAIENAQKQVEIQKRIVADSLAKHNSDNQNYATELQEIKFGKDGPKPKPVNLPIGR